MGAPFAPPLYHPCTELWFIAQIHRVHFYFGGEKSILWGSWEKVLFGVEHSYVQTKLLICYFVRQNRGNLSEDSIPEKQTANGTLSEL